MPASTTTLGARHLAIALNAHPTLSRPALYRLVAELPRWLGSAAPPAELARALGVPLAQLLRAQEAEPTAAATARAEIERAARLGGRLVTAVDAGYPVALARLELPPPVLAIRGELSEARPAIAIVGSRRADAYGREAAHLFGRSLAAAGISIVSGFARGIDAAAHRAALAAPEGRTVAVLGCGLGVDYPQGHGELGDEIAHRGAVVTEFPCGAPPRHWHFPVRNRSIAALAGGVLVVQAALRSGSLVTVRHALDLGREVWAIPGSIFDERALGTNALIRDGAALVQHPRDILDQLLPGAGAQLPLFPDAPPAAPPPDLPGLPGRILATLGDGPSRSAEELAAACEVAVDQALGALLELELGGYLHRLPGPVYGRGEG